MAQAPRSIALAAAFAFAVVPEAHAHAFLDHSEPKVGSTVQKPPAEVRIWFTEALEPAFSSISVTNAAGSTVTTGNATVDPKDPKLLEVGLSRFSPGPMSSGGGSSRSTRIRRKAISPSRSRG